MGERPPWRGRRGTRRLPARLTGAVGALAVLLGALVVPGWYAPASAAGNGRIALQPVSVPGARIPRAYFTPVLTPGVQSQDAFTVLNETSQPVTVDLYAADAHTTSSGGFAIKPRTQPKVGMGAWIHLPVTHVTLQPKSGYEVPFTYDPPANATPGDHAGGIVAAPATPTSTQKKGTVRIQAIEAVGVAVYGRVPGPLHPNLAVTSVSTSVTRPIGSQFGGPVDATVTYSVTNTGNENLKPSVTVSLSPLIGSGPGYHVQLPQILPGSTVTFRHVFKGVVPFGHLTAKVTVKATGANTVTTTAGTIVVPWGLVGVVILLLALLAYYLYRRRRRRYQGPKAAAGGGSPGGDSSPESEVGAAAVGGGPSPP